MLEFIFLNVFIQSVFKNLSNCASYVKLCVVCTCWEEGQGGSINRIKGHCKNVGIVYFFRMSFGNVCALD